MAMKLTEELAAWVSSSSYDDLPAEAIDAASTVCFDCLGVSLAGSAQPTGRKIIEHVCASGEARESVVLGAGVRVSAASAALANGVLAHAMDFDSAGGFGHPAAVLLPALLSLAQRRPTSGRELLTAYVVGCEVGLALYYNGGGAAAAYSQLERGLHATPAFGRVAATAACANLRGLGREATIAALGIAASSVAGLVVNFGTDTKPLHAGAAARDAVIATELAERGWTAGRESLEHPLGLMRVLFGDAPLRAEAIVARLGKVFLSPLTYAIKRYPTCGFNIPVIESLAAIVAELGPAAPQQIERVELLVAEPRGEGLLFDAPQTALEAKFSARWSAAATVLGRQHRLLSTSDADVRRPELVELMERVVVRPAERDAARPAGLIPVRVHLRDGRVLERSTPPSAVEGACSRPLAREQLVAKFRRNAGLVVPTDRIDALVERWLELARLADVGEAVASTLVLDERDATPRDERE